MPYLHYYELFYIVIIVVIIIGKSYSHEEKGVKNYKSRVDNKYFNPLKQQSIISQLSYQCYKNISIKINLLSDDLCL